METAYHVVRFEGLLDVSRYPEFRAAFEAVPRSVPVLVDLTLVESVDSTFLTEVLMLKRRHAAKVAVLIPPGGHVARIFVIAHIGAKLDVHSDLDRAVSSLGLEEAGATENAAAE
jgi:anti-anti-sigma regulatory factor